MTKKTSKKNVDMSPAAENHSVKRQFTGVKNLSFPKMSFTHTPAISPPTFPTARAVARAIARKMRVGSMGDGV